MLITMLIDVIYTFRYFYYELEWGLMTGADVLIIALGMETVMAGIIWSLFWIKEMISQVKD